MKEKMTKEQVERAIEDILPNQIGASAFVHSVEMPRSDCRVMSITLNGTITAETLNEIGGMFGDDDIWIQPLGGMLSLSIAPSWAMENDEEKS